MDKQHQDDSYSEQETARRREATLKRMLATPHTPHKPIGKKKRSPAKRTIGKGRARVGKAKNSPLFTGNLSLSESVNASG